MSEWWVILCLPLKYAYSEPNETNPLHPWENNSDQAKSFFNHYVQSNYQKLSISPHDFEVIKNEWALDNYVELFDAWWSQCACSIVAFLISTNLSHTQ